MANYLFKGLCHVGIMTDNAEESVKWYCEKLGFRPWYAGKMGPMPLTFVEGYGLVIEFISAGKMAPGGPIAHIALEVLNIEDAVADLRAKGVLRGGGDTRFLMIADIFFLWVASIPLGALAGLVWHLPTFWIYCFIRIDQVIKSFWCIFRLRSGKWIKKVSHVEKLELKDSK